MQTQSKTIPILIIIVVILAIGVGIYTWVTYEPQSMEVVNSNTNTVTNSNANTNTANQNINNASSDKDLNKFDTVTLGVTSVSERFISANYNFSFQPPADLYIIDYFNANNQLEFNHTESKAYEQNYDESFLVISTKNQEPTQVDGVNIYLDTKPTSIRTIDGLSSDIYLFPNGYEGVPPFIVANVNVNGLYYYFKFWNVSEITDELATVLDSVSFDITSTVSLDTSDWLTYENEEHGFSFNYPPDWYFQDFNETDSWFRFASAYLDEEGKYPEDEPYCIVNIQVVENLASQDIISFYSNYKGANTNLLEMSDSYQLICTDNNLEGIRLVRYPAGMVDTDKDVLNLGDAFLEFECIYCNADNLGVKGAMIASVKANN